MPDSALSDALQTLQRSIQGDVRSDLATRLLYSTDASIYQVEPMAVVIPRTGDEICAAVEVCARYQLPVLARGAGSSLGGQAIGEAVILDLSRYINRLVEIRPEYQNGEVVGGTAVVEPGLVLAVLNREAGRFGLQFGPDPASGERATLGGCLANNATGAHSILYGMAADHLLSAEAVLSDGCLATFGPLSVESAQQRAGGNSVEAAFYRASLKIRQEAAPAIRAHWPRTWRRASGYNLHYLLPWSASQPPGWDEANLQREPGGLGLPYPPVEQDEINLAPLLAGSEGTLAVIRRAELRLVPLPKHTILGVLAFASIAEACDATPAILEHGPSAVELIPQDLIRMARTVPAFAGQLSFISQLDPHGGDPAAILAVEFSGSDPRGLRLQAQALAGFGPLIIAESAADQQKVWTVRKVGLGILMSIPGDNKPCSFIEDLAVPVENLGIFIREIERIFHDHHTQGDIYAHASAGCLHIRPTLNLKTVQGVEDLREIAAQAVEMTLRLGGSVSGEHGNGLARSEWLPPAYGREVMEAFRGLKSAADPHNILNPGKLVGPSADVQPSKMDARLRFDPQYHSQAWQAVMSFGAPNGLEAAIEHCNGAGVCRKADGVMCPSFQATQEEMHSTRGRANLLRAMISGRFPTQNLAEKTVYQALDLCLACKGCKAECPSAVDMAKLKYEFLNHYAARHGRKLRDYLFGYIGFLGRLGHGFAPLANPLLASAPGGWLGEKLFGLSRERALPKLSLRTFSSQVRQLLRGHPSAGGERVLFLNDAFSEYFQPEVGLAAVETLLAAGCQVELLPVIGAGRTLISKGFLDAALRHARRVMDAIEQADPQGKCAVVGVEPSEIYTLRDEYLDLLPGEERAEKLARRAWMVDEYLVRPRLDGSGAPQELRIAALVERKDQSQRMGLASRSVLLHGHCYQKAQPPAADGYPTGVGASVALLQAFGFQVQVIDSTCCGMAGAFGYEAEHYQPSMQVAELSLLPAVRAAAEDVLIAAAGVSCQAQIADGAQRAVVHPVQLVRSLLSS